MIKDGYRPENPQRKERKQERTERCCVQQSPCASAGSIHRDEWNQKVLVRIENSSQDRILLVQAKTTEEVRETLFREIPGLCCNKLFVQFFLDPMTVKGRVPIEGDLSTISEVYATVYLYKH